MNFLQETVNYAEQIGGRFVTDVSDVSRRLEKLKALVFDWDGVFNDGSKGEGLPSTFNEGDTAGINMFRFAYWLKTGQVLPVFIVSGQQNATAVHLAKRDAYSGIFFRMANKTTAVKHIAQQLKCKTSELFCMYDDTIDLSMAALCGIRAMVNRPSAVVLRNFVVDKDLTDYITGANPGAQPIREMMEILLQMTGNAEKAFGFRTNNDKRFYEYTVARSQMPFWGVFTEADGQLTSLES